jgi:hypothetical protein
MQVQAPTMGVIRRTACTITYPQGDGDSRVDRFNRFCGGRQQGFQHPQHIVVLAKNGFIACETQYKLRRGTTRGGAKQDIEGCHHGGALGKVVHCVHSVAEILTVKPALFWTIIVPTLPAPNTAEIVTDEIPSPFDLRIGVLREKINGVAVWLPIQIHV